MLNKIRQRIRLVAFAIVTERKRGNEPLAVRKITGCAHSWNPEEDNGWIEYMAAKNTLSRYPILKRVLRFIGV